jgi:hypothetical protein
VAALHSAEQFIKGVAGQRLDAFPEVLAASLLRIRAMHTLKGDNGWLVLFRHAESYSLHKQKRRTATRRTP